MCTFFLSVPAAKLFIREISKAVASANDKGFVSLNKFQREEVLPWQFLDDWRESLTWKQEKHFVVTLSTNGSGHGWGCIVHGLSGDQSFGDSWNDQQRELFIPSKEMLALVHAIKALPQEIGNCRLDVLVDSHMMITAWGGRGARRPSS